VKLSRSARRFYPEASNTLLGAMHTPVSSAADSSRSVSSPGFLATAHTNGFRVFTTKSSNIIYSTSLLHAPLELSVALSLEESQ
jgi:hypothetical protein